MAIVIRFNTIIIRKSSIAAKYPGGVNAYRDLYLPHNANFYYEDWHLIAHTSMGAFYGVHDRLMASGLTFSRGDGSSDCCYASMTRGVDPSCQWLESGQCCGGPICWLRGTESGFVIDFKPERVFRRIREAECPACNIVLGNRPAAAAVDIDERRRGPAGVIHGDPEQDATGYVGMCPTCQGEMMFDESGRFVGNFR